MGGYSSECRVPWSSLRHQGFPQSLVRHLAKPRCREGSRQRWGLWFRHRMQWFWRRRRHLFIDSIRARPTRCSRPSWRKRGLQRQNTSNPPLVFPVCENSQPLMPQPLFCRASPKSNLRNLFFFKIHLDLRTLSLFLLLFCSYKRSLSHHSPFSVVFFLCISHLDSPRSFCLTPLIAPFRPSFLLQCNARMGKSLFIIIIPW